MAWTDDRPLPWRAMDAVRLQFTPVDQYGAEEAEHAYRHVLAGASLDEVDGLGHGVLQRLVELAVEHMLDERGPTLIPLLGRVFEDLRRWPEVRAFADRPPWLLSAQDWDELLSQARELRRGERAKARRARARPA